MALITDYASLQAQVATFLIRGDQTAQIPTLIQLAESRLNRVLRERRAETDMTTTAVVGQRELALPSAYSEALNLWITLPGGTEREALRFVDPAALQTSTIAGRPYVWTIDGASLAFERPCDQAYTLTIRSLLKFALSDASPTNALLSDYPDAYLFAALCEAGPLLRDQDVTNAYETKLTRAIGEINAKDARSRAQQSLSTEPGQLTYAGRRSGYDINSDGWR